jgi:hypothetical protein
VAVTGNGKAGISLPLQLCCANHRRESEIVIKVLVHKSQCIQIVVGRLIVWTAISIGLRKLTTNALPPASTNRRKLSRVSER